MTKKLLSLLLLLAIMVVAQAKDRTDTEMMGIATAQLKATQQQKGNRAKAIKATEIRIAASNSAYSIYNAEGLGCVIVSRDTAFPPVIGYTDTEFSSTTALPCGFKWWLKAVENTLTAKAENAQMNMQEASVSFTQVPAFVTTVWGQDTPYNDQCPAIKKVNAPSGCVATAMSQIMRYHKYPTEGKGTGSYTINNSGIPRSKTINATYDWNSMIDDYGYAESPLGTEVQRSAVATLMFDAGAAAKMDYGSDASGALSLDAAAGLVDNFSYCEQSVKYYNREYFSDDEWMALVYGELQARRPILYGGVDNMAGGHAFVLDGIDNNGLVHVNWGWNGSYNGFVDINILNGGGYSFAYNQDMVIGIKAQKTPDAGDEYRSQWATDSYTASVGVGSLTITITPHYNIHYRTFNGDLAICCKANDGTTRLLPVISDDNDIVADITVESRYGFRPSIGETMNYTATTNDLPAGTYTMFFASKDRRDTAPQPVRCEGGAIYYTLTKAVNGTLTLSEPQSNPTAITTPTINKDATNGVYSVDGYFLGKDINKANKGIYIINGKKIVK